MIAMLLGAFAHIQVPMINDSGWVGMAFSAFVVIIAALNLIIDFDFISKASIGERQNIWNGMAPSD